jgi:hypothetical protein
MRSMRPKRKSKTKANGETEEPEVEPHITERTTHIYATVHNIEGHTYMDLTGRFPSVSSQGYNYILVLYHFDTSNILAEPMKNRSDAEGLHFLNVWPPCHTLVGCRSR